MIIFKLDKLLAERKMTTIELAQELGCTRQTVSRIKSGKMHALSIKTLQALCTFFDCQPGDILVDMDEDEATRLYGASFVEDHKRYFEED